MESNEFAEELETWMRDSGRIRELRTKLRADLVMAIRGKAKQDEQKNKANNNSDTSKAVNSLLLEHLSRQGCWYTATVFSSEADVLFETGSESKLGDQEVSKLLTALDLGNSEALRVSYYRKKETSLLECLLRRGKENEEQQAVLERLEAIEQLVKQDQRMARRVDKLRKKLQESRSPSSSAASPSYVEQEQVEEDVSRSSSFMPSQSQSLTSPKNDNATELGRMLEEAKEEIKTLREESRGKEEELKRALEAQREQLAVVRELLEKKVTLEASNESTPIGYNRQNPNASQRDAKLDAFLTEVRGKIDSLYQSSVEIDQEFSRSYM